MKFTKNQVITGAAVIGGIILFSSIALIRKNKKKIQDPDSDKKEDAKIEAKPEVKPVSYSYAEGQEMSEKDKEYELYKKMIGMGQYIMSSTDSNALRLRKQVENCQKKQSISKDAALLEVLKKMNAGKAELEGALKLIDGNLREHIDYYYENRTFKINE